MSYEDLFKGKGIVASDTETTGLMYHGSYDDYGFYPAAPFAFSFTTYENKNWYVRFEVDPYTRRVMYEKQPEDYFKLVKFFKWKEKILVFHNANFDLSVIQRINIPIHGTIIDTMILSHIDNVSMPLGLKELCIKLFDISDEDQKDLIASVNSERRKAKKLGYCIATKERGFGASPNKADYWLGNPELCKRYALLDTDRTMGLYWAFEEKYNDVLSDYRKICDIEHDVMHIVRDMQDKGIKVDTTKISELITYYERIIADQKYLKADMGFQSLNPRSSKQMREVFYNELELPKVYKKRKDKDGDFVDVLTTDSDTLNKWSKDIPLAKCLVEISAAEHQLNTFIYPFKDVSVKTSDGMILRPSYKSVGPITGRISCAKPNLMNISSNDSIKRVSDTMYRARECFIPRKDYVLYFLDYSQIEVWITAFLSQDPIMVEYLLTGGDLHGKTGDACFNDKHDYAENKKHYRKKGKTLNFGCIYGLAPKGISEQLECEYYEAVEIYDKFWATYRGLSAYNDKLVTQIEEQGYITNPFGRRYYARSSHAYRALNMMVQGSAAEVIKRAMINMHGFLKPINADLLLTIHDELGIEVHKSLDKKMFMRALIKKMQGDFHTYFNMSNPFKVSVERTTTNWAEKKEVKL